MPASRFGFDGSARGKFDGVDMTPPSKGVHAGREGRSTRREKRTRRSLTFKAGTRRAQGHVELEQVGRRGIGKKTLEFEKWA